MENLQDVVVAGVSLAAIVFVLVSQAKRVGLRSKHAGWAAIGLGVALVGLNELVMVWPMLAPFERAIVLGVSVGALAMGIFASEKQKPG